MQTLQVRNQSAQVTVPKNGLRRDGIIDETFPADFEQNVVVDRLAQGQYLVRLVNVQGDGDVPELLEAEAVQRAAAQLVIKRDRSVDRSRAD